MEAERITSADDGRHDFDFVFGKWHISNRKKVNLVVEGDTEWVEFDAEGEARPILGGIGNVDTYKAPHFPERPGFEGFTLRLFEPETGLWRIWWASSIASGALDEPVVGGFENGTGRFECEDVVQGVPVRVRYDWTIKSSDSLLWEQSFSFDKGETWDKNWIMESTRVE